MNGTAKYLRNEQGMILLTVLLLLSLLIVAGLGAAISVQNDLRMTANLRGGTVASYLADAGIEWGKQQVARTTTMPPTPAGGTHSLQSGSYQVSILSSIQVSPLSAGVVLRSVGSANNALQTVQARVTKAYDLADAALALRGNARNILLSGADLSISGFDHDPSSGAVLPDARPRSGVTVATIPVFNQLGTALGGLQKGMIAGDDGHGAAVAVSDRILPDDVARIATALCAAPNAGLTNVASAENLTIGNEIWGNRAAPELRCVNGLPGSGDSVTFGGNTGGAGILVVRDAELILTGNFRWEGLILVSGADVGFRVANAEDKQIFGAVIVHESGNATGSGPALLDLKGSIQLRFSRRALNLAPALMPTAILRQSLAALPFTLKQDYWRSISP